jgi:hydrogenase expression/formation protein HypE
MNNFITLAHGGGGQQTDDLISQVFKAHFQNPLLTPDDAAVLPFNGGQLAFTTDGFVVSPAFFAGGDIGKLSICGTINDLACMGARPLYITCSFIIEEGFAVADLQKIAASMAETANKANAVIVAGDTKVVAKGECDGVYITTSGIGRVTDGVKTGGGMVQMGDAIIVTGDIGRHGAAVIVSRGLYEISADIESDCAPLWGLVEILLNKTKEIHCIRDATRGGVATVLYEIAHQSVVCLEIEQDKIPVCEPVNGICDLLGLEPLYLACEGRMVIFVPQNEAENALAVIKSHEYGKGACIIGCVMNNTVTKNKAGSVIVNTHIGGKRLLAPPTGELLPRIC